MCQSAPDLRLLRRRMRLLWFIKNVVNSGVQLDAQDIDLMSLLASYWDVSYSDTRYFQMKLYFCCAYEGYKIFLISFFHIPIHHGNLFVRAVVLDYFRLIDIDHNRHFLKFKISDYEMSGSIFDRFP